MCLGPVRRAPRGATFNEVHCHGRPSPRRGAGLRPRPRHPLPHAADVPRPDARHHHVHRAADRHELPLEPAGALQRRGGARGGAHRAEQRGRHLDRLADQLPPARTTPWAEGARHHRPRAARSATTTSRTATRSPRSATAGSSATRQRHPATRTSRPSPGQTLNGAFTVWIRRNLLVTNAGTVLGRPAQRRPDHRVGGRRPLHGPGRRVHPGAPGGSRPGDAVHPRASASVGEPCLGTQAGQEGGSPMGENFNPCAPITAGAAGASRARSAARRAGTLESTGVE